MTKAPVGSDKALTAALEALPISYPGPGGAVAVLRDGEVLARHSWGWADAERRVAFTPQTLFRICSISKQFTCALMLDRFPDPTVLDADVQARLPLLTAPAPTALHLAHNQSGLRDYWATAMLCGSPVEAPFDQAQSDRLIGMTRTLHFTPGTRYSYCNQNFRLLSEIVEARTGRSYSELLRTHIFDRAEMPTAQLCADTSAMPDGTIGYEGNLDIGFRPAVNRILWTGDAGLGCSLDDMIAWERFIDRTRDDAGGLYRRLSAPVHFADGAEASYGFGLARVKPLGAAGTGHGGGLRGWTSFRCYLPEHRISVVVLFNHIAESRAAALSVLAALIEAPSKPEPSAPETAWGGAYREPETGLVVRLEKAHHHKVKLFFSGLHPDLLDAQDDGSAGAGAVVLRRDGDAVWMDRRSDNLSTPLAAVAGPAPMDIAGIFHSAEYAADFTCDLRGGAAYGALSGFLGAGFMAQMLPVGPDLWRLPMPRALDHSPPGDWTVEFARDADGRVVRVSIGCWLARRVVFERVAEADPA